MASRGVRRAFLTAREGRINLDDLFSERTSLRNVNDGYAALKDDSLTRVVNSF